MKKIYSIPFNFNTIASVTGEHNDRHVGISALGKGLINDTYLISVNFSQEEIKNVKNTEVHEMRYILQRINTDIFKDVDKLMCNISKVSKHLQSKNDSCCLVVVPTTQNKSFWRSASGECWRMYKEIPNSISFQTSFGNNCLYEAGRAYGEFQRNLSDMNVEGLYEILKDFHNTPMRMKALRLAVQNDVSKRVCDVHADIAYIESKASLANVIFEMIADGRLPKRVSHNDTKLDNILFDKTKKCAICAVDYDTVMPNGSILYDYGDAIRSMSNTSVEDERDLEKVDFDLTSFEQFTQGYLNELNGIITEQEKEMLPKGALVITLEQAIRFLTDYLMGDIYFKIEYADHNLVRSRNQLKLFERMLSKEEEMKAKISSM